MNLQPIDLPSLLRAVIWPVMVIVAVVVFRRPLANMVGALGQRVSKLSFGGFSLELAQVKEMQPHGMDTEIREPQAGLIPQSGSASLTALVNELRRGAQHDYVLIDLGSESSPRWLTSRLYLLSFLITLISRQLCFVFVETAGGLRKRFVGIASPEKVRWALARRYGWLESAGAGAYAMQAGLYATATGFQLNPVPQSNQFDPATGYLGILIPFVIQQFLAFVRSQPPPPEGSPERSDWVSLDKGVSFEHAKWLNGQRIESLLGTDLSTAHVTLPPNTTVNDLTYPVLAQQGRFVAIVEPDRTFHSILDRQQVLENVAREISKDSNATRS